MSVNAQKNVLGSLSREPPLSLWGKHLSWIRLSWQSPLFSVGKTLDFILARMILLPKDVSKKSINKGDATYVQIDLRM